MSTILLVPADGDPHGFAGGRGLGEGVAAVSPLESTLLPRARIARDQITEIRRLVENSYKKAHPVRLAAVVACEAVAVLVKELEDL